MKARGKFERAIAEAASHIDHGVADRSAEVFPESGPTAAKANGKRPENEGEALAEAEAAFAAVATLVGDKHGLAIIWKKPRVGRRRTPAEYSFWKRPIMAFIELPETLDLGPTALARRFSSFEPSFAVTKDTFRAPLSKPARKEAGALLKSRGYNLKLPADFSIRDVQKAMKDQRDRANGIRRFKPNVEIVGDTVYCDGKSFKMQPTTSGKMRIRAGGGWLPVDALAAFLSGQP